jgi:hypothetical protein
MEKKRNAGVSDSLSTSQAFALMKVETACVMVELYLGRNTTSNMEKVNAH